MESSKELEKQHRMLSWLSRLPRRILSLHGIDNVTEFVLHDLSHKECFDLSKVAYFVDNPDFNCTKGVAGFSRQEPGSSCDIWANPKDFSAQMKESQFNKRVRELSRCSVKKDGDLHEELAKEIAHDLQFDNYAFCSWDMKHDNHGFVLYEKADTQDTFADDHYYLLFFHLTLLTHQLQPIFNHTQHEGAIEHNKAMFWKSIENYLYEKNTEKKIYLTPLNATFYTYSCNRHNIIKQK